MRPRCLAAVALLSLSSPALADPLPPPPSKRQPDTSEEATRKLRDAQNAYVNGEFQKAIDLARPLTRERPPTGKRAWRVVGASACNLKDAALASEAHGKLDKNEQQFIEYVCSRAGLTLKDDRSRK